MLARKMCGSENKMWIINIGLSVLLFVIAVQCYELELSREAAFQGRCGHGSPCDQLCYELHDGMYECDCTEGYELNKNGYSCQVINSTYQSGDINSSGTEEDVLYQSDALFSAKLDNSHSHNNNNNLNKSNHKNVSNGDNSPSSVNKMNRNNDKNNKNDNYNKISREIIVKNNTNTKQNNQMNSKHLATIKSKSISKSKKPTNQNNNVHTGSSEPVMGFIKTNDWSKVSTNPEKINDSNDYGYDNDDVNSDTFADGAELDENDEDYNGDKQVGSESIVIKFETNEKTESQSPIDQDNLNAPKPIVPSNFNSNGNKILSSSVSNNHENHAREGIKNITNIANATNNNNSPNALHQNNKRMKAYEQRNLYVINNELSDNAGNTNSSIKSYIHIEVYKGNLDDLSTSKTKNTFPTLKKTTARPIQQHSNSTHANTTKISLTAKPDLCLLDCGPDGLCEKNGDIMRCLCPFGKSGNKCENVAEIVSVPRFSKHSWIAFSALRGAYKHVQLHIEFKPETNNGIILLTGERDDLTGDFLAVLIDQGYIEFWFDCGSGTGKVRSNTAIILNQWNTLTVYRYRWDAWIQLNNGQRIQGRSKGLFSRITFREPVFLGGTGNITGLAKRLPVTTGMTGCIRKLVANEHEYVLSTVPSGDVLQGFDIQECIGDRCGRYPCRNGGKCLSSDQGAICLCPLGFGGDLCEMRLDLQVPLFNGSSYLRFVPLGDSALIWLELKIIVKPQSKYGMILYSGHHEYGDYISLSLNNGYVEFAFELGSGPAVVRSEFPLSIEQWHTIRISRTARLAVMKIDQLSEVMTVSPNGFWHLSLPHSLYLGGSNNIQYLPLNLKELGSFIGCIQKFEINGRSVSIISEAVGGTNVDNCPHACTMKPCGVLAQCVPNLESYECQCNPLNLQCNQAEELSVQQNHPTTTAAATFINTLAANDFSKDKIITNIGTKRPVTGDKNGNGNGSDADAGNDDDYYYNDYETSNSDDIVEELARVTKAEQPKMITVTMTTTTATTPTTTTTKGTSIPAITSDVVATSFRTDANTNDSPDDDDLVVTRVFGRYMTVDTDKLLKKEKMMKNKKLRSGKFVKKHYLPLPLLEPQSPSLIDDEVEVDVLLPTEKSENLTTTKIILSTSSTQNPNGNDDNDDNDDHDDTNAKDQMSSEFDPLRFYSNEDVLTTKELIDDMARIMKNGAEIRRNQMDHKVKYLRKSHGVCFTGADSYFHYNDAETMKQIISYKIDLNLRFKTHSYNGLILWSGRHTAQNDDDYLLLGIENGYLHFRYNLGSGEVNIVYNSTKVSDGLWHRIRILRNLQDGSIEVDSGKAVSKRSPGKLRQLNTDTGLYVGGMPDIMYYTSRRYYSGIIGCISEIVLGGELKLSLDPETLGTAHNVEPGYF